MIFLCNCSLEKSNDNFFKECSPKKVISIRKRNIYYNKLIKKYEKDLYNKYNMAIPDFVMIDNKENIYISDFSLQIIFKFNNEGYLLLKIGNKGEGPGEFIGLKYFTIVENYLFCVDKKARRIKKFDLNGNLIWDKTVCSDLPISFECLQVYGDRIFLSGYALYLPNESELSLCYELDNDLEFKRSYFTLSDDISKSFAGKWDISKVLMTVNRIYLDEGYLYFGKFMGKNLLYKYDLSSHRIEYVIKSENKISESYKEIKEEGKYEVKALGNFSTIAITKNFIFISECFGPIDDKYRSIWKQKISIFSKDGKYIYSVWDKNLKYDEEGYRIAVKENIDDFNLYLISPSQGKLYKYFLKKAEL